jgi:hypothetical protein
VEELAPFFSSDGHYTTGMSYPVEAIEPLEPISSPEVISEEIEFTPSVTRIDLLESFDEDSKEEEEEEEKERQEEKKNDEENFIMDMKCCVCMIAMRDAFLSSCKHVCMCMNCAQITKKTRSVKRRKISKKVEDFWCPVCRRFSAKATRVHFS